MLLNITTLQFVVMKTNGYVQFPYWKYIFKNSVNNICQKIVLFIVIIKIISIHDMNHEPDEIISICKTFEFYYFHWRIHVRCPLPTIIFIDYRKILFVRSSKKYEIKSKVRLYHTGAASISVWDCYLITVWVHYLHQRDYR